MRELTKTIEISDGQSGSVSIDLDSDVQKYIITSSGSVTLGGNLDIETSETPLKGETVKIDWQATVDLDGNTLNILDKSIPSIQAKSKFGLDVFYDGSAWKGVIKQDFGQSSFIIADMFDSSVVDGTTIEISASQLQVKDAGLALTKLANMTAAYMIVADGSGVPTAVALSGDVTIDATGAVTIGNDKITTAKILDENVTKDKIEDVSRGSVLIGNSSNRLVELNCSSAGYILLGDGNDLVAVTLSGDVTIDATGAVTIGNDKITTAKILDGNVTLAKIENIGAAKIIVGNASGIPTAVALSGDATISAAGALTIANNAITTAKIADNAITPEKIKSVNDGAVDYGGLASKVISGGDLKALLDGTVNDVFDISSGEKIMAAFFYTQTAAGAACTVDIGVDASARSAGADGDGLISAADANVQGQYHSFNDTYVGALLQFGFFEADGNGKVTLQSSTNQSGSAFDGTLIIYYNPAV